MAFPKLQRDIFANDGAGPLFRKDKIPSIEEADVPSVFVKTNTQTFTDAQKTQARTNIDAVSETELETALTELIAEYS